MSRELMFSVGIKDCEVQTFRAGGPGGQNQNKRDTGVRVIHHPSGAVGESRDERTQLKNKKNAFRRMAESPTFMAWVKMQTSKDDALKAEVERDTFPDKIKVETFKDGEWVEE